MNIAFAKEHETTSHLPRNTFSVFRVLGLGCYFSWVFMLFYMTEVYPVGIALRDMLYLNQTFSTMAIGAGLLICGWYASRHPKFTISRKLIFASTLVMFVGTAFILANQLEPFGYINQIVIASGLLTGFGSSIILASWGVIIIPSTARTRLVECAIAFTAAFFNCFVLSFLPDIFTLLLALAAPAATGTLAIYCIKRTQPLEAICATPKLEPATSNLVKRAITGALFFGLVAGFVDVLSGYRIFAVGEYYGSILLCIAGICTGFILLIGLFVKRDALIISYRAAIFLAILGCMLTPFMRDGYTYPNAIIAGSYAVIQIVMFTLCGTFAKKYGIPPLRCFCSTFGALYLSEACGLLACLGVSAYVPDSTAAIFVIAVILAACLLFSYLFLFTERDFLNNHFSFSKVSSGTLNPSGEALDHEALYARLAQEFSLTNREVDVFYLVIQGRSNTRIQEELFISSGTVSTHINHIYRKCGVANKQELLDIVQARQKS